MDIRTQRLLFPAVALVIALAVGGALLYRALGGGGAADVGGGRASAARATANRADSTPDASAAGSPESVSGVAGEAEPGQRKGPGLATLLAERSDVAAADSATTDTAPNLEELARRLDKNETSVVPARIAGRVTDGNGAGIAGVAVSADGDGVGEATVVGASTAREDGGRTYAMTDAEGFYDLETTASGTVLVHAAPPRGDVVYYAPEPRGLVVEPGGQYIGIDFDLERGAPLEILVINEERASVEGAIVAAELGSGRRVSGETDAEGRFALVGAGARAPIPLLTVTHADYQPEERRQVTAQDGPQTFVLRRQNSIVLAVSWAIDGLPVEDYAYRLLARQATGIYRASGRQEERVATTDGRTKLAGVESGAWRVEVRVVDPDGVPTELRASQEFELLAGQDSLLIPVEVSGGADIVGTTVLGAGGPPIEQVAVEFVPPTDRSGGGLIRGNTFRFPNAVSDSAGGFRFEGMPPGRYSLRGELAPYISTEATDVEVPWSGEDARVEVVLRTGGVVFGTVFGAAGEPLPGALVQMYIQSLNGDDWISSDDLMKTTDADGAYRIEGLTVGAQYMLAHSGELRSSTRFNLGAGEERRVDFDFSGRVLLRGHILLNGAPAFGRVRAIAFASALSAGDGTPVAIDSSYEARVFPGAQDILVGGLIAPIVGRPPSIVVAAEPAEQTLDFDWRMVDVDVRIEYPEGQPFVDGKVTVSPPFTRFISTLPSYEMTQPTRTIPNVMAGSYQASFRSKDEAWSGATEFVEIGPDAASALVIRPKRATEFVRLGGWKAGDFVNAETRSIEFDISEKLTAPGRYEIYCDYESGRYALVTERVELMSDTTIVSNDIHNGWAGNTQWNTTYRLDLEPLPAAPRVLRLSGYCDGGTDSNGSVYLTLVE